MCPDVWCTNLSYTIRWAISTSTCWVEFRIIDRFWWPMSLSHTTRVHLLMVVGSNHLWTKSFIWWWILSIFAFLFCGSLSWFALWPCFCSWRLCSGHVIGFIVMWLWSHLWHCRISRVYWLILQSGWIFLFPWQWIYWESAWWLSISYKAACLAFELSDIVIVILKK